MSDQNADQLNELRDAWLNLAATGTPPAFEVAGRVLPEWSVGLSAWLDRLTNVYLRDYCRRNSHFKLALAPYGGGKTHFLLALGSRAAAENWAVCYLQCKANISIGDWFKLYENVAKSIQLPNQSRRGLKPLAQCVLDRMRERAEKAPEPGYALDEMIAALADEEWPHSSFASVMAVFLNHLREPHANPEIGEAALRWLQGQPDSLSAKERQMFHLQSVRPGDRSEHGRTLFYSLVKFIPKSGAHGLTLLLDEMDTILNVRGKALEKILTSMRVMLDAPDSRMDRIPLFGAFAAVPDIIDQLRRYQALASRFQPVIPFHKGDDNAAQIDLGELGNQNEMLTAIGEKLLQLGLKVHDWKFDLAVQRKNLRRLANVTSGRILEVNARRLFVKAWCSLLEDQARSGQREFQDTDLADLIQGVYAGLRRDEETAGETDVG